MRLVSANSMSSTKSWRVLPMSTMPEGGVRAAVIPDAWRNARLLNLPSCELQGIKRRIAEFEPDSHRLVFESGERSVAPDHLLNAAAPQGCATIGCETGDRPARLVDES